MVKDICTVSVVACLVQHIVRICEFADLLPLTHTLTQTLTLNATSYKNIIKDLTSSVQISQEILRSSYKIYLIRRQVKNLTCSASFLLYRRIRISKIRSDQDTEQINSDLSGNICSRLSKITLYRSDQDS